MKEYTEVKITTSNYSNSEILNFKDYLHFKFKVDTLKMLVGGKAIKEENGNILFETQGYYERIPKSLANKGTTVEVFKDWKKEEKVCEGIVESKYFTKTESGNWGIEKELDEENSQVIEFDMEFGEEEKEILELGITPTQMEDKWFIFQEGNKIRFFRSWTGTEFYQGELKKKENGKWHFENFRIHLDNNKVDKDKEISYFKKFIEIFFEMRKAIMK